MCYPDCGMMHITEPLLLIKKSSPCGGGRVPLSLSSPLPYACRHITVIILPNYLLDFPNGTRYSSMIECLLVVQWVVGSIPHDGHIQLFLFQLVPHNWCNKGSGMYYPVCEMVI